MRYRAIFDKNGLRAEIENDQVLYLREDPEYDTTSDLPRPGLISDHHTPFKSMLDGRTYDSKSEYRRTLRESGCVELGNDAPTISAPKLQSTRREALHKRLADVSDREANQLLKTLKKETRL